MSGIPYGHHDATLQSQHHPQLQGTSAALAQIPSGEHSEQADKEWAFFPEGVPGLLFRVDATIQSRNAAVSSADFEASTQGGVFQVDDRSMTGERAYMHKVGIPTSVSQPVIAARRTKGHTSLLWRGSEGLLLAMRPHWKLVGCRIILGEGKSSAYSEWHEQEDVEGYCVVGSGPIWAIAEVDAETGHQESKHRVRIFLFAPLRFIINQTGLVDGKFTTLSGVYAATYEYKDGDDGLGGLLVRARPNRLGQRLPRYSFDVSSYDELLQCLRFGGGWKHVVLADSTMKVHIEDWKGPFEAAGFAVI